MQSISEPTSASCNHPLFPATDQDTTMRFTANSGEHTGEHSVLYSIRRLSISCSFNG